MSFLSLGRLGRLQLLSLLEIMKPNLTKLFPRVGHKVNRFKYYKVSKSWRFLNKITYLVTSDV